VAKLYVSYPDGIAMKWSETGLVGAWVFYANEQRKTLHLQLLDIKVPSILLYTTLSVCSRLPVASSVRSSTRIFNMPNQALTFMRLVCTLF